MSELQKQNDGILSKLVLGGDLSGLNEAQKVDYYKMYCERLGLDPLTMPFKLIKIQGKEVLYPGREAAQQLNKIYQVSHEIVSREKLEDVYMVTARAFLPDGRKTESIGVVTINGLKGDNLCNALMKAETKAKRRATLDLLGLGIISEEEIETLPNELADQSQLALIENLIHTCTLDEKKKIRIEAEMFEYDKTKAGLCIDYLQQHQKEDLNEQFDRKIKMDQ